MAAFPCDTLFRNRTLITASEFRDIVSGRRQGFGAALWRAGLGLAEAPYSLGVRWRNHRYDVGKADIVRVEVPVVSVGNLTLGGTGKTPMVEWLARWFRSHDIRVAIVSRGYGAVDGGQNDEARELEEKLPDVPHLQDPDRVAAARVAIGELATQLIVLDDGFQHRRLGRDLDIVLIDAVEPFGYGRVFPRGMLREPLIGMRRADVIGLTRADVVDETRRREIRARVQAIQPQATWVELTHQPCALITCGGEQHDLDRLENQPIAAFCGIGNPTGFRHTLSDCGWNVVNFREFPDHHPYERRDIESLRQWATDLSGVKAVVCTHKDLVKVGVDQLAGVPLYALSVQLHVMSGFNALQAKLQPLLHHDGELDVA